MKIVGQSDHHLRRLSGTKDTEWLTWKPEQPSLNMAFRSVSLHFDPKLNVHGESYYVSKS